MKALKVFALGAAIAASTTMAKADTINGGLTLNSFGSNPVTSFNATSATFSSSNPNAIISNTMGSSLLTPFLGAEGMINSFNTSTTGSGFLLFTVTDGASDNLTFTLNGLPSVTGFMANQFLNVAGTGTLAIDGADQTPFGYTLDLQESSTGSVSILSFTLDATTVPEPSSLALLGTTLLGAAGVARRRFFRG